MAGVNDKRNFVDDLADRMRELLDEMDRLLQPKRQPARAPIPVRVRDNDKQRRRR